MKETYILVVYYDAAIRNLITQTLNYYGYKTISANIGKKALDAIRDNYSEIGLILLGIIHPDITGFSILQLIKSNEKYRNVPVVIMTVRSLKEDKKKAMDLGANDVLNLPYEMDDFLKCVKNHIRFNYGK